MTKKGVDTAIVTGLLSLAGEGAFDAAVLVSSDTDYLPAVEWLQSRGFKVINATWANHGHELARACWASLSSTGSSPSCAKRAGMDAGPRPPRPPRRGRGRHAGGGTGGGSLPASADEGGRRGR